MADLNYSKLREKCCYCFKDVSDGLQVCGCLLSFCDDHYGLHKDRSSCKPLFYVENKGGSIEVTGENLTEEEKIKLCKRIEMILKCEHYDEKVIFKDGEVDCPHLPEDGKGTQKDSPEENTQKDSPGKSTQKISLGKLKDLKCGDCEISKNLYVCLSCGFLGCGRLQYGVEGNGHAMNHYKVTGHEVSVLVQSITPEYACDSFCYKCNDFIVNPYCDTWVECEEFAEPGSSIFDVQYQGSLSGPVSDSSPFLGIKNAGNTCYVSSVLQLYGFIVSKKDISLEDHFLVCQFENPLTCIYCQTARILNEMRRKSKDTTLDKANPFEFISISDFLKLVWLEMGLFTKNLQHDANEFLMIFTEKIREGEEIGIFPHVTKYFSFGVENSIRCEQCKKNNLRMESHTLVYTPFNSDVQASLDEYFADSPAQCECGGEMWISNKITSLPSFFIVTIGRIVYKDEGFYKVTDRVGVDHVDLTKYLRRAKLSNYFCEELKSKGFCEGEISLALSGTNNFNNLEERIEEYRKLHKTNPFYNIGGSIVHSGSSMDSGHYMWWVRALDTCFLVNDRRVTEDNVDNLENSYILVFE